MIFSSTATNKYALKERSHYLCHSSFTGKCTHSNG